MRNITQNMAIDIQRADFQKAQDGKEDRWVPACGGFETPFSHNGTKWLYVYNHATERHAYLNLGTDIAHENFC